jgi:hypothetical protein
MNWYKPSKRRLMFTQRECARHHSFMTRLQRGINYQQAITMGNVNYLIRQHERTTAKQEEK